VCFRHNPVFPYRYGDPPGAWEPHVMAMWHWHIPKV